LSEYFKHSQPYIFFIYPSQTTRPSFLLCRSFHFIPHTIFTVLTVFTIFAAFAVSTVSTASTVSTYSAVFAVFTYFCSFCCVYIFLQFLLFSPSRNFDTTGEKHFYKVTREY